MITARIKNLEEFNDYRGKNQDIYDKISQIEDSLIPQGKQSFIVKGFSYPAKEIVNFLVDYQYSDGKRVNWRERVVCPITGLNNRLRACIHLIDFELGLRPYHNIYIAEQVTPLYTYLKKYFPKITGSEYLGDAMNPGSVDKKGLRHETATSLSFADGSLDAYLSFECIEHIPDYNKAFSEAARVLKSDGKFLWSVPFANINYDNIIRAFVGEDGKTYHVLEPEYHGNPVSGEGILCFTHFGWQMLDQVKKEGFREAYALLYWSDLFGYLGGEQILFIAKK
jgi:SAM-dependent methyltransferase